jgi:HAD superfamily hydrolase (TIGR01509 family)
VNSIDWIFFDIGNVIFYDLPLLARIWRHFYLTMRDAGMDVSYEQMLEEREKILHANPPEVNPRKLIAEKHAAHIPDEVKQQAYKYYHLYPGANVPLPGAHEVLSQLGKDHKLGVIANQPGLVRDELDKFGLTKYFSELVISDEVGLHKPDVRIFEYALEQTKAEPGRCVMVGDRVDNDVRPAQSLGMRTVWLDNDYTAMPYVPLDDYERRYIESYLRISGVDQDYAVSDAPDARITTLTELPAAVIGIESLSVTNECMECVK